MVKLDSHKLSLCLSSGQQTQVFLSNSYVCLVMSNIAAVQHQCICTCSCVLPLTTAMSTHNQIIKHCTYLPAFTACISSKAGADPAIIKKLHQIFSHICICIGRHACLSQCTAVEYWDNQSKQGFRLFCAMLTDNFHSLLSMQVYSCHLCRL